MTIDDNTARVISTVAVWAATAVIFVFGVFHFSATGDGVFWWFLIALALAICPALATRAIWKSKS